MIGAYEFTVLDFCESLDLDHTFYMLRTPGAQCAKSTYACLLYSSVSLS